MSAKVQLKDVYVSSYEDKKAVVKTTKTGKFIVNFKVSNSRKDRDGNRVYDNYTITCFCDTVELANEVMEKVNSKKFTVTLTGDLEHNEFNGKKFMRVVSNGATFNPRKEQNVQGTQAPAATQTPSDENVPF